MVVSFYKGNRKRRRLNYDRTFSRPALNKDTSATLSKSVIELLRKQLNYDGLVISDALNMHSVSKLYERKGQLEWEAFNAGNDVLCFAENIPEGIQEILKNAIQNA
jgi:beta-glucosidase-like glycosyl hydrolase